MLILPTARRAWRIVQVGTFTMSRQPRAQWLQDRRAELLDTQTFMGLHAAGAHCGQRPSEQDARLRPFLPRHCGDPAHHRCRSQESGRRDRLLCRATHLVSRRPSVDRLQAGALRRRIGGFNRSKASSAVTAATNRARATDRLHRDMWRRHDADIAELWPEMGDGTDQAARLAGVAESATPASSSFNRRQVSAALMTSLTTMSRAVLCGFPWCARWHVDPESAPAPRHLLSRLRTVCCQHR